MIIISLVIKNKNVKHEVFDKNNLIFKKNSQSKLVLKIFVKVAYSYNIKFHFIIIFILKP